MLLKFLGLCVLACALVAAEPKKSRGDKKATSQDRISALYVKDNESGQLRFLTGSGGSINQLITQKQDLLETLRPQTSGSGLGGANVTPIIVDLGALQTTAGTTPVTTTGGGSYTTGTGTGVGGGGGGGGGGGNFGQVAAGASPIADLLPQIVGQAVVAGGGQINQRQRQVKRRRRKGGNRRRRRRPQRRRRRPNGRSAASKSNQLYVLKPQ